MRRLIVFATNRAVDPAMIVALEGLRPHAVHIVVTGELDFADRSAIGSLADEIIASSAGTSGFGDVFSEHRRSELGDYDEIVLTDDEWFGPLRSFDSTFHQVEELTADLWSIDDDAGPLIVGVRPPVFDDPRWITAWIDDHPTRLLRPARAV